MAILPIGPPIPDAPPTVEIFERDNLTGTGKSKLLNMPLVTYTPLVYSLNTIGGPRKATITAIPAVSDHYQAEMMLWEHAQLLRCPVLIKISWLTVWWGFIKTIYINLPKTQYKLSLDSMSNRIGLTYTYLPTGAKTGRKTDTTWNQDDASVAKYGTKELLASIGPSNSTLAAATVAALLEERQYPAPQLKTAVTKTPNVLIECAGWWETLGWQYYGNSNSSNVETTTQIDAIVSGATFITDTTILQASGISSNEYQNGSQTRLQIITNLLRAGTSNDRRLLANIDSARVLTIDEEPAYDPATAHLLLEENIYDLANGSGNLVLPGRLFTGWLTIGSMPAPAQPDPDNPNHAFVDETQWDNKKRVLSIRTRANRPADVILLEQL